MKIPKTLKKYCPTCKKHTEQKASKSKKRKPRSMSQGSKVRAKKRGASVGTGNHGKYSKPAATKFKRGNAKTTKKTDIRYLCVECNKSSSQSQGIRAKKVEFI
jgi:large subunit ribosomal protein L44e